jgi:DNA-binding SARP family transcriptional activator/tetratricopeptide (TPR) repeat protein
LGGLEVLHISLLGEQAIADATTGIVHTRSSRTIALVAFLVVHAGTPQSRQRIAAAFWPDSTDAQALTNLRRELHQLRQVLDDEPSLVVTSKDLCWHDTDSCRVDARRFGVERDQAWAAAANQDDARILIHATAAIAEYAGDLLPGVYDEWLLDVRSELERRCVDLCDLVCATRSRTGDLAAALDVARRRIQLQPLEEVGYRTLMRLQADLGDRAGAVSTYHHCASVLDRELGIEPDHETRKTLHRLLDRVQPAATPMPTVGAAAGRSGAAAAALIGRSREITVLHDLWQASTAGRPSMALVRGDAGAGKTRLVTEVADAARQQGAVVAVSQCFGTSGRLALAPVADWLRDPTIQATTARLDPVWRVEVDRLVPPAATERGEPRAGSRAMVDAWQRHRFFEGMARALIGVGRPMLLVLDNLQWCDQETLAFLTFCLGLTTDAPVMLAATLRNDSYDGEPELADWTARMRATGMLTELSLGPLEPADTALLATAISGRSLPEGDVQLLQAMTGGFPLYVVEAARTAADLGGTAQSVGNLTAVLRNRFDQVTPVARDVAGLAAAVGRNFSLDLLTEASDLDANTVVQAVDELWRRRIVREFRDGYDFSHDLLRDTAYNQVSPPKRWLLHRRLAQGLELLSGHDTDVVSVQLAEQYARGGQPARAVGYYRRAADIAAGRFAHAEAIRRHKDALSILLTLPEGRDRDTQELEILEAIAAPLNARYGYSSVELQHVLERAIVLAEALGRTDSALTARIGLWSTQFVQGNFYAGHLTVTRALALVDPASDLGGPAQFAYAGSELSLGRPAEALSHFQISATLTRGAPSLTIGTRPEVHGMAWAAHAHWLLGHDDEALATSRQAIALARSIGNPYNLAVALAYGCICHQMRRDTAELRDTVTELRELCERYDFAYYREWGLILDGWSRQDAEGIGLADQGIKNLKAAGSFARMPFWLSAYADLLGRAERHDAARAVLDAALVDARARHDVWWLPEVMRMRAAYDHEPRAVTRLDAAADLARSHGSVALLRRCEHDLAERGVRPPSPTVPPPRKSGASARTLRERHGS